MGEFPVGSKISLGFSFVVVVVLFSFVLNLER